MSANIFAVALDAISKAKEYIEITERDDVKLPPSTSQTDRTSTTQQEEDGTTTGGPETMSDIERKYEERRKVEAKKDQERGKEINRFQKDVDDAYVTIDLKLRKMLAIQAEDLAEEFGLVRTNVDASSSRNMKALADRQMREQALLSLQSLTTRFTNKRIHEELIGTSTWLDGQHNNHVKNFEKLGIAVSEIEGYRPGDKQKEKDLIELLDNSEALLAANSSDKAMGSAAKIALLSDKFKDAQQKWKDESATKIQLLEKEMIEKAGELRLEVRKVEDKLVSLRKRGAELDKLLSGTKEGQMREAINSRVKDVERRYEYHIERQKVQIADIDDQIEAQKVANEAMQHAIQVNMMQLKMESTKAPSKKIIKKGKENTEGSTPQSEDNNDSNFEIEEHLSHLEDEVKKLKAQLERSNEDLANVRGLAEDRKEEVNTLQNTAKQIKLEISTCMSRQKSKVRALQNELMTLTKKNANLTNESEDLYDRLMALSIAQSRRQNSTSNGVPLNLDSKDESQGMTEEEVQRLKDDKLAPGHTRLWPIPNANANQGIIYYVDRDEQEEEKAESHMLGGDDINYKPSSLSHVCEASYRHFAGPILAKDVKAKGKSKSGRKKKGKEVNTVTPTYSYKEAVSVCVAIATGLMEMKHLDKSFLNSKISDLNDLKREIPIMKPRDAEQIIYNDICIPLITHITTYQINNIIAENKMYTIRLCIVSSFALLGVLFMCVPNILGNFAFELTPHPGFIKHMEDISSRVLKKLLSGSSIQNPADEDRPTSRAAKQKKTKSGKEKKPKVIEVDDPLHPRTIYKEVEKVIIEKSQQLHRLGLHGQVEVIRQWVGSTTSRGSCHNIHKDWASTSSNGMTCKGRVIYSEDRFGLCAYQILLYELSSMGLKENTDIKYPKLSGNSLNNFKECLDNIKKQSSTYTTEFSNIESLLKHVAPCSVPIILAFEFIRKVIDEELAKQSIYSAIENGTNEDLQYLKSSRTSTAVGSRATTAGAREDAYLRSLPPEERQYLLDMQMTLNLAVDDVLEAFEIEGEGDDYDTVKISEFLKKHITKHMYLLDDLVLEPFNKEALPKVKSEIYKFQKHIEALKQARNKTLDVGGEYTKPLRSKLNMLNDQLAMQLEKFHAKCYQNKINEAEIIEMQQETTDLYEANRNVVKGAFAHYPDEIERICMLIAKDTDSLQHRRGLRQAVRDDCEELRQQLSFVKESYQEMQNKLVEVGNNLTYTADEASTQGAHIIIALLSDLLQYFEAKNNNEAPDAERANMAALITKQRRRALATQVDTEKILRHILGYFGEEDLTVLGAVFLDESISRSMSEGLLEAVEEVNQEELMKRGVMRVTMKDGTQIDAFNITNEKESLFRNGTGLDPRKKNNKKERKMSTMNMESFVNEETLPTALKTSDAMRTPTPKSRGNSGGNSRRPSMAGGGGEHSNVNSRPTSQSRRPTSSTLQEGGRRKPSSSGYGDGVPLSRETNERFEELGGRLLEQFMQPMHPPEGLETKMDFQSIVPPGAKLAAFNDSECTSKEPSMSTITTRTKNTSRSTHNNKAQANVVGRADGEPVILPGVPLLDQQNTQARKATLALLSGGDGVVSSYVTK